MKIQKTTKLVLFSREVDCLNLYIDMGTEYRMRCSKINNWKTRLLRAFPQPLIVYHNNTTPGMFWIALGGGYWHFSFSLGVLSEKFMQSRFFCYSTLCMISIWNYLLLTKHQWPKMNKTMNVSVEQVILELKNIKQSYKLFCDSICQ